MEAASKILLHVKNGSDVLHSDGQPQEKTLAEWVRIGNKILLTCYSFIRDTEGRQNELAFDEICKILLVKALKDTESQGEVALLCKKGIENERELRYLFGIVKAKSLLFEGEEIRVQLRTFKYVLSELDNLNTDIFGQIKGLIFDEFLTIKYGNDFPKLLTPHNVIDYMVTVLAPQHGESVCDPCCGSGGFLVKSYEYVRKTSEKSIFLYGVDINERTSAIAKMNMYLKDIKHFNIYQHDGLEDIDKISENKFDVVFATPPFKFRYDNEFINEKYHLNTYKRGDILFVERCLNLLKPSGRMGIVLAEDILFQSQKFENLYKFIESQAKIIQIISLPSNTFLPITGIKTSILFFQKMTLEEKNAYAFVSQNSREKIKAHLESNPSLNYKLFYADITDVGYTSRGYNAENNQLLLLADEYKKAVKQKSTKGLTLLKQADYTQITNWSVPYLQNTIFEENKKNALYPFHKIGTLMSKNTEYIKVEESETYKRVTVKLNDNGVILRDIVKGEEIGTKRQIRISKGQLIVAKIGASRGAIGIVPDELDKAIVTQDFLTYTIDMQLVLPNYLGLLLSTKVFTKYLEKLNRGSVIKRLDENLFLNMEIPLPSLAEQAALCQKIIHLKQTLAQTINELDTEKQKFENALFEN